jgi:hypothetical protein
MSFQVSQTIRNAVFERILAAEANGRYVNVYEAAQAIQDSHPAENVALEDIVATFIDCAAGRSLALELSQPRPEGHIAIDIIIRETA